MLTLTAAGGLEPAHACETPPPPSVTSGILGFQTWMPELVPELQLPRNLALAFGASDGEPRLELAGEEVALVLLGPEPAAGETGLMTPEEPLEPGAVYQLNGSLTFQVADFIDTEPPTQPELTDKSASVTEGGDGCGQSSCGTSVLVTARIEPGSDDRTPTEHLTYALYLGASDSQAQETQSPARFGILEDGETWFFADVAWKDRDMYLSVAALDFAGNQSTRTEPVLVHRGASRASCSALGLSSFGTLAWVWLVLALQLYRRRAPQTGANNG